MGICLYLKIPRSLLCSRYVPAASDEGEDADEAGA